MFKNYLRIAWRNLTKNGLFSWLNIGGLSMGLAVTILLLMFILAELNFDTSYSNSADIYRVLLHTQRDDKAETWSNVPNAVGPELSASSGEVKYTARVLKHNFGESALVKEGNTSFIEKNLYWCDSNFLRIFSIPLISGNRLTALSRPNTAVVSAATARRLFGKSDALGKTILIDNETTLEITGVFKDVPSNSTFDGNIIGSFATIGFSKRSTWDNASFETWCLLNDHTDTAVVNKKLQALLDKNIEKENQWFTLSLQPLSKVHLYSAYYKNDYSSRNGDMDEVKNLLLLAFVILLIACINYINLATARSQKRAKEVGISKTLGASFKNMLLRFYAETALLTFLALVIGVCLACLIVPLFNSITGKELSAAMILTPRLLLYLFALWLAVTLIAGSYPAAFLARFPPNKAIRQKSNGSPASGFVRKTLVVGQFIASIILISVVLVVFLQLRYIRNKKMGYNPENVVAISTSGAKTKEQIDGFINSLQAQSNVLAVCRSQGFPGLSVSGRSLIKDEQDKEGLSIQTNRVTGDFVNSLQLKLLAGKPPSGVKSPEDTVVNVVLNKKAVDYLGFTPEQAIGKKVTMQLGNAAYVVGVVDNFNFESLHKPISGYAFHDAPTEGRKYLLVRFRTGNLPQTMKQFETLFKAGLPDLVFDYVFLDQQLATLYAAEKKTAAITLSFSVLAILIACLGLFGLSAYTAEQRTKEIGVRKVLGANINSIVLLLSKDFLKLVFIAIVIAVPIAWWAAGRWLQDFAYRIDISLTIFLLTGLIAIVIAMATISFQAVKAAIINPVKSLRTE